jgi:signal transduction histidine kinase
MVFEIPEGSETARIVTGTNVPAAWAMRAVNLYEVKLLADAIKNANRVHTRKAISAATVLSEQGRPITACHAACAAVPTDGVPSHVFLLLVPDTAISLDSMRMAVDLSRRMVSNTTPMFADDSSRATVLSQIYTAKMEWESVVDAAEVVSALLDHEGHVVRASRALTRWTGHPVDRTRGRALHDLLHPTCEHATCMLRGALKNALIQTVFGKLTTFEWSPEPAARVLKFELRSVAPAAGTANVHPRVSCIVSDVTELKAAGRRITALNEHLETRVVERTAELQHTNEKLREAIERHKVTSASLARSRENLAKLSNQLIEAQEVERKRIALDLHDSVGQSLTAIKFSLEHAAALVDRDRKADAHASLERIAGRVSDLLREVRHISMNLRPTILDDLGAASAVRYFCREWSGIYTAIQLTAEIEVEDSDVPDAISTDLFRTIQELLNNVARHAAADKVYVGVEIEKNCIQVTVRDNGKGLPERAEPGLNVAPASDSRGMRGLRERTAHFGGACQVTSEPGCGTEVRLSWPLQPAGLMNEGVRAH